MQKKRFMINIGLILLLIMMLLINGCVDTGQIIKETDEGEFLIVDVKIPVEYLFVKPGESVTANIEVIRSDEGRKDYNIQGYIIDEEDHIVTEKTMVIAIETRVNTLISFNLPSDIKAGNYRIEVFVNGAKTSSGFTVKDVKDININLIYILILIFIGFLIAFYIYNRKLNKFLKNSKKIDMRDIIKK